MPIPNGNALSWKKLCFLMPIRLDSLELVPHGVLKRKNKICFPQPAPLNAESASGVLFLSVGFTLYEQNSNLQVLFF